MRIQQRLAHEVREEDVRRKPLRVAGFDAAFTNDGADCIGAVVLWDMEARMVSESRTAIRKLRFPYVPGLLSFREAPAILAALRKLRHPPDVLMADGHGRAHPRRLGIASHIGVLTGLPTIGCAKSRLIGMHREPAGRRGARTALKDGSERIGTVVRTRDGLRPVFVSVGHRMTLRDAERIVLACSIGFRLPEPVRLADRLATQLKRGFPSPES